MGIYDKLIDYLKVKKKANGTIEMFLKREDYNTHFEKTVIVDEVLGVKNERDELKIIGIIGDTESRGVENLKACAKIAGLMSILNRHILTVSFVSNVTVGIGAYLARLCGRVIQHENAPLLLTGFRAINTQHKQWEAIDNILSFPIKPAKPFAKQLAKEYKMRTDS